MRPARAVPARVQVQFRGAQAACRQGSAFPGRVQQFPGRPVSAGTRAQPVRRPRPKGGGSGGKRRGNSMTFGFHHDLALEGNGRTDRDRGSGNCRELLQTRQSVLLLLRSCLGVRFNDFGELLNVRFWIYGLRNTDLLSGSGGLTFEVEPHGEFAGQFALVPRSIGIEARGDLVFPGFILLRLTALEIDIRFSHGSGFPELQNVVRRITGRSGWTTHGWVPASRRCGAKRGAWSNLKESREQRMCWRRLCNDREGARQWFYLHARNMLSCELEPRPELDLYVHAPMTFRKETNTTLRRGCHLLLLCLLFTSGLLGQNSSHLQQRTRHCPQLEQKTRRRSHHRGT